MLMMFVDNERKYQKLCPPPPPPPPDEPPPPEDELPPPEDELPPLELGGEYTLVWFIN